MYIWAKFSNSLKCPTWKAVGCQSIFALAIAFCVSSISLFTASVAAASALESEPSKASIGSRINKIEKREKISNSPGAKRLAQKILASYGGEEKFKQVYETGCHGFGKYTQISSLSGAANVFDIEIFNKGDKIREEIKVLGEVLVGGYDGNHSWLKQYGEVIEDNPAGRDQTRQEIEHGLQVLLKLADKNTKIDCVKAPINSNFDILKVTAPDGISTVIYASKKTHLIARSEFVGIDEEQGLPATKSFHYEDYRPYEGCVIPYKMSEYSSNQKVSETILLSIRKESLADSLFQIPKANPPLLGKNESVTIPFQLVAGEILINVSINGKPGYAFIVDTGATQTLIDSTLAPQLGTTNQSDLTITTGTGSVPMSYMKLKSLTIGNLTFKDIPAVVADLSAIKKVTTGQNLAGLLGANIMRQYLTTFDFMNKTITFANPDSEFTGHQILTTIPAKPSLGGAGLMIEGELDGKKIDCLIDTGAVYSLIPYELAKQIGDKSLSAENAVHGLDGKPVKVADGRFFALKLGEETIYRPAFLVAFEKTKTIGMIANGSVAILGNPTWKNYCLTLDYKGQKIILSHHSANTK